MALAGGRNDTDAANEFAHPKAELVGHGMFDAMIRRVSQDGFSSVGCELAGTLKIG